MQKIKFQWALLPVPCLPQSIPVQFLWTKTFSKQSPYTITSFRQIKKNRPFQNDKIHPNKNSQHSWHLIARRRCTSISSIHWRSLLRFLHAGSELTSPSFNNNHHDLYTRWITTKIIYNVMKPKYITPRIAIVTLNETSHLNNLKAYIQTTHKLYFHLFNLTNVLLPP